jgi:aspartyl-tRNA(Asn)/glutamyl-tRNA(Gln) amidotransferase subunit A
MGKTGLHELAYGITSNNPHYGAIHNPHDLNRIPGGSSGGSGAAVAAGLVFFAMGSDTGGSIRVPAAFCGCAGFKPTFGLVDRRGLMPLSDSFDHVGPMTRTVEDAALVTGLSIEKMDLRIGDKIPNLDEINAIGRLMLLAEAASVLGKYNREDMGADVRALIEAGLEVKASDYLQAKQRREEIRREWDVIWQQYDVITLPTVDIDPPLIADPAVNSQEVRVACTKLVRPFNVLGFPAISVPIGKGLQIVGNMGADRTVLSAAARFYPA